VESGQPDDVHEWPTTGHDLDAPIGADAGCLMRTFRVHLR